VRATILLADYAQVAEGKLNIIGGGWSVTGPNPTPSAVAVRIEVPWDQANTQHHIVLELTDEDGHLVMVPNGEGGSSPVQVQADLQVGRPPGLKSGTPLDAPFAVNVGPLPLVPGTRYSWNLHINGETEADWRATFSTRPMPDAPDAPQP